MIEITLADSVWADVEEGTEALLDQWLVKAGEQVKAGQPLAMVELVKTSHEITAPKDGTISAIKVGVRETFRRGQAIAILEG